jgi:hypothetical protein
VGEVSIVAVSRAAVAYDLCSVTGLVAESSPSSWVYAACKVLRRHSAKPIALLRSSGGESSVVAAREAKIDTVAMASVKMFMSH